MAKLTRRSFITRTTISAATIGVAAGAFGGITGENVVNNTRANAAPTALTDPLMIYVTNASTGEVTFLMGTREVTRRDPALIAILANAMA